MGAIVIAKSLKLGGPNERGELATVGPPLNERISSTEAS
jgi:hypothetical protein